MPKAAGVGLPAELGLDSEDPPFCKVEAECPKLQFQFKMRT